MRIKKFWLGFALFISSVLLVVISSQYISIDSAIAFSNTDSSVLNEAFKDTKGAFVLYDAKNNQYLRHNEKRCNQRFGPESTFKIPNSLIALETGIVKNENVITLYNREQHPPEAWWPLEWQQNQNLRSAVKYSVVWYFQEIAKKVGKETYQKYLKQFQYGNEDISSPIDQFWLRSSLQISPNEEVEFLKKFYNGELPVSKRSTNIVKDILVLEQTNSYKLSGKTGLSRVIDGKAIGWLVGYLEKPDNVYFFATNLEDTTTEALMKKRLALTKQIFTKLGLLF